MDGQWLLLTSEKVQPAIGARLHFHSQIARPEPATSLNQSTSSSINHQIFPIAIPFCHVVRSSAFCDPKWYYPLSKPCDIFDALEIFVPAHRQLSDIFCFSSITIELPRYGATTRADPSWVIRSSFSDSPTLLLLYRLSCRLR